MTHAAIIVAAGAGSRLGGELPKQFLDLDGMPLVARAVRAFDLSGAVERILVALPPAHLEYAARVVFGGLSWRVRPELVAGGAERWQSVSCCLARLGPEVTHVLVHDGARPLVSPELVRRIAHEVIAAGAVIAALPEKNTLKLVDEGGNILKTVTRAGMWEAQTPQAFRIELLREAHSRAGAAPPVTDDAELVERLGHPVKVVTGEETNFKVTTHFDLALARLLARSGMAAEEGSRC
jgi:2-C-methyl-D-erythritol 4-phosphate cytidylyltransferase